MDILVDTSIWIDYFAGGGNSSDMDALIDENLIVTNELILAELIPYLKARKHNRVVSLLRQINRIPLQIDWEEII
jgi:predicted nucleic acid-binding protein